MQSIQDRVNRETLGAFPRVVRLVTGAVSYQMKPGDNVLIAYSDLADDAGIVYLPSLAEALGKFYHISAPQGATGGDISLYIKETGAELATNGDMDADGDNILLFAAPTGWVTVYDGVA